jgi:hypothetical protein
VFKPDLADLAADAKQRLENIRAILKDKVDPEDYTPRLPKVAFKLLV